MRKNLLSLPIILLILGSIVLASCDPSDSDPLPEDPFTFKYSAAELAIPVNGWPETSAPFANSNNQKELTGTFTGMIKAGKTYNVKITGTLSHSAVLKVFFVDKSTGWNVLTNYGSVYGEDSETNLPLLLKAGELGDGDGVVIKVTGEKNATDTSADANIVVLMAENTVDETVTDKSTDGLKITDAAILIAEEGKDYPVITLWEAPAGAEKIEVAWNKPEKWATQDIEFPYTTAVPASATAAFTLYFPASAVIPAGDTLKVQLAAKNNAGSWENIGLTPDPGITVNDLVTQDGYLVYNGTVSGGKGLDVVTAIVVQLAYGYINYSGPVAVKLGAITAP
jgi:hypothetical protein